MECSLVLLHRKSKTGYHIMLNEVGGPIKDMQKNATIFSKHFSRITKNLNLKKGSESLAEFSGICKAIKEKFKYDHFSFKLLK